MSNSADSYERAWIAEKEFQIGMMEDLLVDLRKIGGLQAGDQIRRRIILTEEMVDKVRQERIQRHREENARRRESIRKDTGEEVRWQEDHSTLSVNGSTSLGASIITWWKMLFRRS